MVGKKPTFDVKNLLQILQENRDLIIEGRNFKKPSHPCWRHLADILNMSPKHIYSLVILNRYNIKDKLLDVDTQKEVVDCTNASTYQDYDNDSSESQSDDEGTADSIKKCFTITLTSDEWEHMHKKVKYSSSDRIKSKTYDILTPFHWTGIFNEQFFRLTKLSCCLTFKRCKIYPHSNNTYMRLQGHCKTCSSILTGVCENEPTPKMPIMIDCIYQGSFMNCCGTRKRRILGEKRSEYEKKLITEKMSASFIRRSEAGKLMDFGDPEPSHLPTLNALRLMKFKSKEKYRVDKDPIISILKLKGHPPFDNIIRDVGYDPFYLHYWTSPQINIYRNFTRNTKIPSISIDATGSVVWPVPLISGRKTNAIFLYQIAVMDYDHGMQFSVCQMLSETHNNHAISYWLSKWVHSKVTVPKICVTDSSKALMMACVKSFTQYSTLQKYLDVCYNLLRKKNENEIPHCMLRNDFAHTMHLISSWVEFKNTPRRFKQFYMRAIALIVGNSDRDNIKLLLKYIFTVSLCEYEGLDENGVANNCEIAKKTLKILISGQSKEAINIVAECSDENMEEETKTNEYIDLQSSEPLDDSDNIADPLLRTEIAQIYNNCMEESKYNQGDHENFHFGRGIAKRLIKFCDFLPCWSAVMVPIFGYGNLTETSASSESLFKELKHDTFRHEQLPIRVDEFLNIHIESIMGATNISKAKYLQTEFKGNIDETNPIIEEAEENWRGLTEKNVVPSKSRKKNNYLNPDPSITSCTDSQTKCPVIGLILNGNISSLNSITIDNLKLTLSNTCTFDTIIQILFVAYADSKGYCTFVNNHKQELIFEMIANGIRDGVTAQCYYKRASILKNIFLKFNKRGPSTMNGFQCIDLDTRCTSDYLLNELFPNFPSIVYSVRCICNLEITRQFVTIVANLQGRNILHLEDVIKSEQLLRLNCTNNKCLNKNASNLTVTLGTHLFIEPVQRADSTSQTIHHFEGPLSAIPKKLTIFEEEYKLRGIINFVTPGTTNIHAIGHYIAYCWREPLMCWTKFDDLRKIPENVRPTTVVYCQQLVYTLG